MKEKFYTLESSTEGWEKSEMEQDISLKGIQFIVDPSGKRTAVIISLEEWGELWEDIYDVLVSESRRDEPTLSWEELRAEIDADDVP